MILCRFEQTLLLKLAIFSPILPGNLRFNHESSGMQRGRCYAESLSLSIRRLRAFGKGIRNNMSIEKWKKHLDPLVAAHVVFRILYPHT